MLQRRRPYSILFPSLLIIAPQRPLLFLICCTLSQRYGISHSRYGVGAQMQPNLRYLSAFIRHGVALRAELQIMYCGYREHCYLLSITYMWATCVHPMDGDGVLTIYTRTPHTIGINQIVFCASNWITRSCAIRQRFLRIKEIALEDTCHHGGCFYCWWGIIQAKG